MRAIFATLVLIAIVALTACGGSSGGSSASQASFTPSTQTFASTQAPAPPPSPSPVASDPAVTVCQDFSGIEAQLTADLNADSNDPSSLSVNPTLDGYANDLSHWSYVVNQAVDNGTTTAGVGFANDLGDAGIATVQVAEPLPGVTPDVESAITDVDAVEGDCSALSG
jgi:hypothetical protein